MKLIELKKELPYMWRVQSTNDYNAVCVAYIDSRDVQDLLDSVVGPENWQSDYKDVKGNLYAGIGIKCGSEWVWKWDCGVESKTEAEKGEASDSFKRAAVKWGIGRFLYSLEIKRLKVTEYKGKKYPLNEKTNKAIFSGEELTEYINQLNNKTFPKDLKTASPAISEVSDKERDYLNELLGKSTYEEEMRKKMWIRLNEINTIEDYEKAKANLLMNQLGIDGIQNPSQKDINRHLKQTVK